MDTWTWDDAAQEARREVASLARESDTYAALNDALYGYDYVLQKATSGPPSATRAYLAFMGPRLVECHRVLHPTGSMYLHCDSTASHYLKGLMDAIFGSANFKNEIIWKRYRGKRSGAKTKFPAVTDTLLFYVKSKDAEFALPFTPLDPDYVKRVYRHDDGDGKGPYRFGGRIRDRKYYLANSRGVPTTNLWDDVPELNGTNPERLGYPTQKPRALYERIIAASSKPGDLVLDPFCGCGTTIDAAETLNRQWIGIDITLLALDPMQKRLRERHGLEPSVDYDIAGYPTNMQEVTLLVRDQKKYHDFANWAVTRAGLEPTANVGDGGFDGASTVKIWNPRNQKSRNTRVIAEVKSGKPNVSMLRAFCHTIRETRAQVGIFITLEPVSGGMKAMQEDMGTFQHNGVSYPRLQFWQIDDGYFANPESLNETIRLPWRIESRHKSERHFKDEQTELMLKG